MVYYAVIDTNVFISSLLLKRADAATVRVLDAMLDGKIIPLYHEDNCSKASLVRVKSG